MPSKENHRSYSPRFVVATPPKFPTPPAGLAGVTQEHPLFWADESGPGDAFPLLNTRPNLPWTGSRRLLLGVLQDALRAFFQTRLSSSTAGRRKFKEVQEWIWSPEQDWIYSFESICAHLRLDPAYIRQGLQHFLRPTHPLNATHRGTRMTLSASATRRPFQLFAGPGSRVSSQKLRRPAASRPTTTAKM